MSVLDTINRSIAADLDPVAIRQRIEADQAKTELRAKAIQQKTRLDQHIHHLERKHARLPIGNGKRKTAKALAEAKALAQQLGETIVSTR